MTTKIAGAAKQSHRVRVIASAAKQSPRPCDLHRHATRLPRRLRLLAMTTKIASAAKQSRRLSVIASAAKQSRRVSVIASAAKQSHRLSVIASAAKQSRRPCDVHRNATRLPRRLRLLAMTTKIAGEAISSYQRHCERSEAISSPLRRTPQCHKIAASASPPRNDDLDRGRGVCPYCGATTPCPDS